MNINLKMQKAYNPKKQPKNIQKISKNEDIRHKYNKIRKKMPKKYFLKMNKKVKN